MLRDTDAVATIAVKDLGAAAEFYERTLGLSSAPEFVVVVRSWTRERGAG